jgi:threonine dehydratase
MKVFTGKAFGDTDRPDRSSARASAIAAKARMKGLLRETPLVSSADLDQRAGCSLRFKAENLQRTGSYKPRGSFNSLLVARERGEIPGGGVIVDSSGNYGQATAKGAQLLGIPATVVMPEAASAVKARACAANGATVIRAGVSWNDRGDRARACAEERDLLYVPADAWDGMAGDATLSLEIFGQTRDFDTLIVPLSSGGLIAGVAVVAKAIDPAVRIVGVQPAASGHALRSLREGRIVSLDEAPDTIADGARTLALGERPFQLIKDNVDAVVLVEDEWTLLATWLLMTRTKMLVEPSGALPLAAVLRSVINTRPRPTPGCAPPTGSPPIGKRCWACSRPPLAVAVLGRGWAAQPPRQAGGRCL